jgi:tight adherence protein B
MDNTMLMVGSLVFVGVLLAGGLMMLVMRREHTEHKLRLEKHMKKMQEKEPLSEEELIFAQQRDDYLGKLLAQAGLESKYDQMKQNWIMTAIGVGAALGIAGFVAAPELSIIGVILGVPIGAAGFVVYIRMKAKKRQDRMTEQLPQVLESMVGGLRAGSPVMEVFRTLSETAPEPIRGEFKRALVSLQLGKSFRDVLDEMCTRIRTPDFRLLTQAIFISQDVGGNLAEVVATIAEAIRERFKLRDFLNSLTAQGKATAWFIGCLPFGITGLLLVAAPGYMGPFFNNMVAKMIFFAMVAWELFGIWILMKLTSFEI